LDPPMADTGGVGVGVCAWPSVLADRTSSGRRRLTQSRRGLERTRFAGMKSRCFQKESKATADPIHPYQYSQSYSLEYTISTRLPIAVRRTL
jgi:hypothetical protein